MNFKDFLEEYKNKFPPYYKTTKGLDIFSYTNYLLEELWNILNKIDEKEYKNINANKSEVLNKVLHQSGKILYAISSFCSGDIATCYETIFREYFWDDYLEKEIFYKKIAMHGPLYRLRFNKASRPYNQKEMFHIPFTKTHLVSNQRFSLSGYPCLYLGNSSYGCWEELERPDLERCNFSILRTEREMNLVDLSLPTEIKSHYDLLRLPLIISCAIKITNEPSSFKPEYIIPQSVLQGVIRLNNKKHSQMNFDGIIYLSTKVGEKIYYTDNDLMFNYVFPTIDRSNNEICIKLNDMFSLSNGITYQELWLKYPQLIASFHENSESRLDDYDLSVFDKIEKYLKGKTIAKSKILDND